MVSMEAFDSTLVSGTKINFFLFVPKVRPALLVRQESVSDVFVRFGIRFRHGNGPEAVQCIAADAAILPGRRVCDRNVCGKRSDRTDEPSSV